MLVFCLLAVTVSAQTIFVPDSVIVIGEVSIGASRLEHFTTGNKIMQVDSSVMNEYSSQALADLLAILENGHSLSGSSAGHLGR